MEVANLIWLLIFVIAESLPVSFSLVSLDHSRAQGRAPGTQLSPKFQLVNLNTIKLKKSKNDAIAIHQVIFNERQKNLIIKQL